MKVKIRDTVGNYQRPDKIWEVYYPGDIIEVPESDFYPDIMEKIEPEKKEEPVISETEVPVPAGYETEEAPLEPVSEEPKKTRRKRSVKVD